MFIEEKQSKLDSARIKLLLMEYFRYKKQFFGVVSEYRHYCDEVEDFVAFKNYEIAVVEIKISKSDFLADFKKIKHAPTYQWWYSQFYFCVTEDLKDFVLEYLKGNGYGHYGVLIANNGNGKPYVSVARAAKRKGNKNNKIFRYGLFHSENYCVLESIMRRMSSEMIIDKRKAITLKDSKIKTHS